MGIFNKDIAEADPFTFLKPSTPKPLQPSKILPENQGLFSKAMDVLARPSEAGAGAVRAYQEGRSPLMAAWENLSGERHDTYSDVLGNMGVEGPMKGIGGFIGDVALDPLNLLMIGPVAKGVKVLGKAAGLGKVAKVGSKILESKRVAPVVESLGRKFVPFYETKLGKETLESYKRLGIDVTPQSYQNTRRLVPSKISAAQERRLVETFNDILPGIKAKDAKEIAYALDEGRTLADPVLEAARQRAKIALDAQWTKEVAAGVMPLQKNVKNYISYLIESKPGRFERNRVLSGMNKFARDRKLTSLRQVEAAGGKVDARQIIARRLASGDRSIFVNEFFQDTANQFGSRQAVQGWRKISVAGEKPIKTIMKEYYFPPEIAQDLEKLADFGKNADEIDNLFKSIMAVWKGYATRVNPGFHIRNHFSNWFNSWLGGMSPAKIPIRDAEAISFLRNKPKNIGKYSGQEILTALDDLGIRGGHHGAFDELRRIEDEIVRGAERSPLGKVAHGLNPLTRENYLQRAGSKVGTAVENNARVALFLDQLHKGKTLEEAALHVKKYLFDYAELTDFEKGIRNYGIPFYTWLRKNIPLQIEALATQPQKISKVAILEQDLEKAAKDLGISVPQNIRPDYMQKVGAWQLPFTTDKGEKLFINPNLPIQDLNRLPGNKDWFYDFLSSINPIMKMPLEYASNKEFFSGRQMYPENLGLGGMQKASPLASYIRENLPGLAESLGTHEMRVKGKKTAVQPAWLRYALNQIPLTSTLGRVLPSNDIIEQGNLPGLPVKPTHVSFLGLSTKAYKDKDLLSDKRFRERKERAKLTSLRKERRGLSKDKVESVFQKAQALLGE